MTRGFYEPAADTTNFYVNVDNDSGSEDGLSHATGFKDIQDGLDGATVGQVLWVHQGATFQGTTEAAYSVVGGNKTFTRNALRHDETGTYAGQTYGFHIIGYANGNTLETVHGNDRPKLLGRVTNGGQMTVPSGAMLSNFVVEGWKYGASNNTSSSLSIESGILTNCHVISTDDFTGTTANHDRGQVTNITSKTQCYDCEFEDRLSQTNFSAFTRDAGYEGPFGTNECTFHNCIFRFAGDAAWGAFIRARVAHGDGATFFDCIFIGNGNQVGVHSLAGQDGGQSFTTNSMPGQYQHFFERCIFYNMNTGFRFYAPSSAGNVDTESEWTSHKGRKYCVKDCIFHTCQTGILQSSYSDPSSWASGTFHMGGHNIVDSPVFYNMTSAQTSGDMTVLNPTTCTEDPFVDAANGDFRLNNKAGGGALLKNRDFPANGFSSVVKSPRRHFERGNTPVREITRSV